MLHQRGGRQFQRGGGGGGNFSGRRRFRGQYVRTRARSNSNGNSHQPPYLDDHNLGPSGGMSSSSPPPPSQHYQQPPSRHHQSSHQQQNYQQQPQHSSRVQQQQHRNSYQQDVEEIKVLCNKLNVELELVKTRVDDIFVSLEQIQQQQLLQIQQHSQANQQNALPAAQGAVTNGDKRRKPKLLKKRDARLPEHAEGSKSSIANKDRSIADKQRVRVNKRELNKDKSTKPLPTSRVNDDSTTQAADPSSEDKAEGDDARTADRVRVVRRKKQFNRRGRYGNVRRRMDSSERNSNDTSPQNELNGDDYRSSKHQQARNRNINGPRKTFRELSEAELNEVVQSLKHNFLTAEISSVKRTIDEKGPVVAHEFASAILDHAICDVTSPTKLSDIATNLFQVLIGDNGGVEFQQGFYSALNDISKREDDIAIDAPRYMDTLGQVLGQCIVPMNTTRYRQLLKRFLNKSIQAYSQQSRALLLASIMRGIANYKSGRFAKSVWDIANLKWDGILAEGTDLTEFLESQEVAFTTQQFSPEPEKAKRAPGELEKFADDVTDLVEKRCTPQDLDELVKDLELIPEERVAYLGTLIYAIVRGCLTTLDSGDYKLNSDALAKYSILLNGKNMHQSESLSKQDHKKELDAIALHALTALTKLWHQYNCPQNLMSTILLSLHGQGVASPDALLSWLNSDDLKNIPGIGAARLNSKRCIEDLVAASSHN